MDFYKKTAEVYVPDGQAEQAALARTTHMAIGAHPDDIEIMAYHGILECFGKSDKHFTGVTVTDGAGSPRIGLYANYSDEEMRKARRMEQKKAAFVGEYSAHVFLDYMSHEVKDGKNVSVIADLKKVLSIAKAKVIYTHNLADKHDTHVSVALRLVRALRELPEDLRPDRLYGCEAWRNLDWLAARDKIIFDVSAHGNLGMSLVGIFDTQICGGKHYDLATWGRRRANATYLESNAADVAEAVIFGMDLTPLIVDRMLDPYGFIKELIKQFAKDVSTRLAKLS
jgi:LmbE family N-acetylglucosaminyl deacetylase